MGLMSLKARLVKLENRQILDKGLVVNPQYSLIRDGVKAVIHGRRKVWDTREAFLEYVNNKDLSIGLCTPEVLNESDWEDIVLHQKEFNYEF